MTNFLQPLVISAPFGNYIKPKGATPTLGTFTALRRRGRLVRILKTVRYSRRMGAWVNKIGLRNPGINALAEQVERGKLDLSESLVSIHGFSDSDWTVLLNTLAPLKPLGIELNISCPNVGELTWPADLFRRALDTGLPIVLKLPPVHNAEMIAGALDAGVRAFHCCNTLPVPGGGLSGKPLLPLSLRCIADLQAELARRSIDRSLATIIGGGGISTTADIDTYKDAGVDSVALGTKTMNPKLLVSDSSIRPLIEHAHAALR